MISGVHKIQLDPEVWGELVTQGVHEVWEDLEFQGIL